MPRKPKPKPVIEKPSGELQKAIKIQKLLQTMQKNLEEEYARLDVEFLQLASMIQESPSNLIQGSTPVVFEDEETINKKDIVLLTQPQSIVTNPAVSFPEEEEEEEEEDF